MFKPSAAQTPEEYIAMCSDEHRADIQELHNLIRKTCPDLKPYMISGMIGYGTYHYVRKDKKEGDWFKIGLSDRKNYISLYVCSYDDKGYVTEKFKSRLPKTTIGKSCINIKKLDDIDKDALIELFKIGAKFEG